MHLAKHLLVSLALLLSLLASPAYAARGFGATDGTATTDKIVTTHTTLNTSTSWCQWIWLTGAGGGGFGRLFDKDSGTTGRRVLFYDNVAGTLQFDAAWTTTIGQWTIAAPATGAWHHLCITYNASATTNDPIFYLDNTTPAVTEANAPTGTLQTNTGAYIIGNRADDLRNLNGRDAEFAVWEGTILTAGNVTTLYNGGAGARADSLATAPTTYWRLCGTDSPEPNEIGGGSSATVTGALLQTHPFSCAAVDAGASYGGAFMLLGQ